MRNVAAWKLGLLQEKPFGAEDFKVMRYEFALDLFHKRLDAQIHHYNQHSPSSSSTHSPFSSSPLSSPTSKYSNIQHHGLPPINKRKFIQPPTSASSMHNDDAEGQMEQEDDNGQPSLMVPITPQGAQQRIAIPSKPFKQFYILLEHYKPKQPTSSNTEHYPISSDEDDMQNAVLTSPNIGPVTVVKKPVKQILYVSPIITFINSPHQNSITIDMKEVPGPGTTQYQGTPEHRNSSWLDAAEWEPLYIIACHDPAFWTWMHGTLTTPTQSRIDDLRRCFALRTAVYQLAVEEEIPKLLQGIRDSFHSRLKMPSNGPHGPLAEPTKPSIPFVSVVGFFVPSVIKAIIPACDQGIHQKRHRGCKNNSLLHSLETHKTLLSWAKSKFTSSQFVLSLH